MNKNAAHEIRASAEGGGRRVSAFLEPRELETYTRPASSDVVLGLFAGGGLRLERREGQGSWVSREAREGDLFLNWPSDGKSPSEVRRWSLSALPTRALTLRLSQALVARAAEEVLGVDLARLELLGRDRFRDPLLAEVAFALWRELERPAPAGRLYAEAAAWLLAVHLVRHYTGAPHADPADGAALKAPWLDRIAPPAAGLSAQRLEHALAYIQAHLGEDLTLEAVARQVGYSPYHFARLFRRATGESLHQRVLRERIARARRLLAETEMPLARGAGLRR